MGEVKPEEIKHELSRFSNLPCPFCGGGWEFMMSESLEKVGLTFRCLKCKKIFEVTKL